MENRTTAPGGGVEAHLAAEQWKTLLRFITCGAAGAGKSTLVERLLHDANLVFENPPSALRAGTENFGIAGGALLADGLAATSSPRNETDVAYRYFSTERRNYIVADTPGHEQYTRNMAAGACTADAAVILVDATKGLVPETCRDSFTVSLLGVRHVALAVNKMDAVGFTQEVFESIEKTCRSFIARLGLEPVVIPLSALTGDNVKTAGANMPWHRGPTLLDYLELVPVQGRAREQAFRFPVQQVNRRDQSFRECEGPVVSGTVRAGDRVKVMPAAVEARVSRVATGKGGLDQAVAGQSVTLTLDTQVDVSCGDLIAATDSAPGVSDQFQTAIIWMHEEPLLPGRAYLMKIGTRTVGASVTDLRYKIDVNTLEHIAGKQLELNEIAVCNLATDQPIPFDAYAENRDTGGFILVDRFTNDTVGAGMIRFALRRAENIHWQAVDVHKQARADAKRQTLRVLWFTGLSGAGKSTIA
ncbi:MAG: elongation factor 1-alpha C-terminal domain-related protein, partial [Burkholderiales bacterium]